MASLPQITDNQISIPSTQGAVADSSAIQHRSIETPNRSESRRVGQNGRVGSQKASRILHNESYCRKAGLSIDRAKPISRSLGSTIFQRAREVLHNTLKIPRGEKTHREIRESWDLQPARRVLEKHFPILALAENQWAATCFLQEVARRDKKKENDIRGGEEEGGGEVDAGAGGGSQEVSDRAHGREVGVFGEGAESQGLFASATGRPGDGSQENQPRSRIAPRSRRR